MARIRTIKPDFFRHEILQDLEADNPGAHVMLVFAALWGHCDKEGRFLWKPRSLKLDILPFLDFDLTASLLLLREAGLIRQYEIEGVQYGEVPTFKDHQRVSGKEAQEPGKYPEPNSYVDEASPGTDGEASGKHLRRQEGKGREQEGKGDSLSAEADHAEPKSADEDFETLWSIWQWHNTPKGSKKAALSEWQRHVRRAGVDPATVLAVVPAYCEQCRRTDTNTQHIERWLKKHRWEDDYGAAPVADHAKRRVQEAAAMAEWDAKRDLPDWAAEAATS